MTCIINMLPHRSAWKHLYLVFKWVCPLLALLGANWGSFISLPVYLWQSYGFVNLWDIITLLFSLDEGTHSPKNELCIHGNLDMLRYGKPSKIHDTLNRLDCFHTVRLWWFVGHIYSNVLMRARILVLMRYAFLFWVHSKCCASNLDLIFITQCLAWNTGERPAGYSPMNLRVHSLTHVLYDLIEK